MIDITQSESLEFLEGMTDGSADMLVGSPPYPGKSERYGTGKKMSNEAWLAWMDAIVKEATRVCLGHVFIVANNYVRNGQYVMVTETLMQMAAKHSWVDRPLIWHKNAAPTRTGRYFSNDYEQILCFKAKKSKPYWNTEEAAQPMKFNSGGDFRQRDKKGNRKKGSQYPTGKDRKTVSDVIRVTVGGGHMGFDQFDDAMACDGKAPFPIRLVSPLIKTSSPKDGLVIDPWVGTGTTAVSCLFHGRNFKGCDHDKVMVDVATARTVRAAEFLGGKTRCPGLGGTGTPCCERHGKYNGFASGPTIFSCPHSCACHD